MFKKSAYEALDSLIVIGNRTVITGNCGDDVVEDMDDGDENESTWADIDADLRDEILGFIEDHSDISLDETQLQAVLDDDSALIKTIIEWGVEDTDVAGQLASKVSHILLGRAWPTFGEQADFMAFLDELRAAAVRNGFAVVVRSPSILSIK